MGFLSLRLGWLVRRLGLVWRRPLLGPWPVSRLRGWFPHRRHERIPWRRWRWFSRRRHGRRPPVTMFAMHGLFDLPKVLCAAGAPNSPSLRIIFARFLPHL